MNVQLIPVLGLGEVRQGDDLAELVCGVMDLRDGDVLVVSQKIVSKAEGAIAHPLAGEDRAQARRRLARERARRIVAEAPQALIVETEHGFVCANAGIDASNVPDGALTLLPLDPDASAARLRAGIKRLLGSDVAVVISDTFGRPWRLGQTDVAIGLAGMAGLRDERGRTDLHGQRLDVTLIAVADELAAAADLVRTKRSGLPAVVVRGFEHPPDEIADARDLLRSPEQDLFRTGTAAVTASLLTGAPVPDGDAGVPPADLDRAWSAARAVAGSGVTLVDLPPRRRWRVGTAGKDAARCGIAAGVLVAVLVDLGYHAALGRVTDADNVVAVVEAAPRTDG